MKKFLIFLILLLAACGGNPPKPPDPVIVTVKEEVSIDPILLTPCEDPSFITGPLDQVGTLKFMQSEATKLILCGKKHRALAESISKAFNVKSPETPSTGGK